ncbi:DUF2461 domain-containing protein [bacterium]|nr:DUF2461 domain-containing protein [bacterium]
MSEFKGFPQKGLDFLANLARHNEKGWFEANRNAYQEFLVAPALAFIADFGTLLQKKISKDIVFSTRTNGSGSLFRIYRDTRFSADKTPYKTHVGVFFWEGPGKKMTNPGFYFHLEFDGAFMYAGKYEFSTQELHKYRDAVANDKSGKELEKAIASVRKSGEYETAAEHYKRVPAGYTPDHPRAGLLRQNTLFAKSPLIPVKSITSPKLLDVCLEHSKNMDPLLRWLVKTL